MRCDICKEEISLIYVLLNGMCCNLCIEATRLLAYDDAVKELKKRNVDIQERKKIILKRRE